MAKQLTIVHDAAQLLRLFNSDWNVDILYSEGRGTSEYRVFTGKVAAAAEYIAAHDHYRAVWTVAL